MSNTELFSWRFQAAFPAANPPPPLIVQAVEWMQQHGFSCADSPDAGTCLCFCPQGHAGEGSALGLYVPDVAETRAWTRSEDPATNQRLSVFVKTGWDGSRAGLWRDDRGYQQLVHLGDPAGAGLLCVLADDPVHLLRLLAMGYPELSRPEYFSMSPDAVRDATVGQTGQANQAGTRQAYFRHYVESVLDLDVPVNASVVIKRTTRLHDHQSQDPFWNWIKRVSGR